MESIGPLDPLDVTQKLEGEGIAPMWGGATTMATCLFVCTSAQKHRSVITAQIPRDIWRTRSFLPTLAPVICVQWLQDICIAVCYVAEVGEWVAANS